MRILLLVFITVLIYLSGSSQVSQGKLYRVTNSDVNFGQALSRGSLVVDLETDSCYLLLSPVQQNESISSLSKGLHYKDFAAGFSPQDSTFTWISTDTLLLGRGIYNSDPETGVIINDNLVVEEDGTIRMDNEATVWDDLNVFPDAVNKRKDDVNEPKYELFLDNGSSSVGVWLNWFEANKEQEVFFTIQLPHSYKEGSDIFPHVHWTTKAGSVSTDKVKWGLEYTVISVGEIFPNSTIAYGSEIIPGVTDKSGTHRHLINSLGTIAGDGLKISSVLSCRLFRAGQDVQDTFPEKAGLLGIDFHYEKDTYGSRQVFTK